MAFFASIPAGSRSSPCPREARPGRAPPSSPPAHRPLRRERRLPPGAVVGPGAEGHAPPRPLHDLRADRGSYTPVVLLALRPSWGITLVVSWWARARRGDRAPAGAVAGRRLHHVPHPGVAGDRGRSPARAVPLGRGAGACWPRAACCTRGRRRAGLRPAGPAPGHLRLPRSGTRSSSAPARPTSLVILLVRDRDRARPGRVRRHVGRRRRAAGAPGRRSGRAGRRRRRGRGRHRAGRPAEAVARAHQRPGEIPALWQRIAVSAALAAPWGGRPAAGAGPVAVGTPPAVAGALGLRPQKVAWGPLAA